MPKRKGRNFKFPTRRNRREADGYTRLCCAVYNDAFLALGKASKFLKEYPDNNFAKKEANDAKEFLRNDNPFGDYLTSVGRHLSIETAIEKMENDGVIRRSE